MATPQVINQLSLVPLGAGDLIDRAVRLYRRHFTTLIRIAAPPVLAQTLGSLIMTVAQHLKGSGALAFLLLVIGFFIWIGGVLLNFIVMGGAARNLITHLLWNEPFSARTTYRNVRARFGGLLGSSIIVGLWIGLAFIIAVFVWALVIQLFILGIYGRPEILGGWFSTLLVVVWFLAVTFLALLLFFLMVKFIAYVPQVLMVEGRGVFDSIGRSFTLARGNLRRLMGMFLFYWFATWSALAILVIPLLWYGSLHGVNILPNRADTWPVWYAIGYSVMTQVSAILLVPIWMLGLSLMYIDERVRQEGYDIELIAARQLTMPDTRTQSNPYGAQTATRQPVNYAGASPTQYYSPGTRR
jgi:hypothetical protein